MFLRLPHNLGIKMMHIWPMDDLPKRLARSKRVISRKCFVSNAHVVLDVSRQVRRGWEKVNGKESEAPALDKRGHSHSQDPRPRKEKDYYHCTHAEANCRRHLSASVKAGRHIELAGLVDRLTAAGLSVMAL